MQISRLFEMVYLLMGRNSIPASELAGHFEVSTRTIYRDVDVLAEAGVPIYTVKGKGGGIRLMPDFVLDKALLNSKEQNEILSALKSMSAAKVPDVDGVLEKLGGLFRVGKAAETQPDSAIAINWVQIDFSDWSASSREKFELIKTAILERRVLHFDYYNSQGQRSKRLVEPSQLFFKSRAWYVRALCLEKGEYRLFKIYRMRNVVLTDQPATHPPVFEEERPEQLEEVPKTVHIVLKVEPEAAYRVYDEFEDGEVTELPDHSFLVEGDFIDDEWLMGYLLTFGTSAIVQEPKHIKERIRMRLMEIFKANM